MLNILDATKQHIWFPDAVIEFKFEEVGIQIDGVGFGPNSGIAHIDRDGAVVGLDLEGYKTNKADPLGFDQKVIRRFKVPFKETILFDLKEQFIRNLATTIEKSFEPDINDKLNDWSVSIAEQSFEPAATIADGFEAIREDIRAICQGAEQ